MFHCFSPGKNRTMHMGVLAPDTHALCVPAYRLDSQRDFYSTAFANSAVIAAMTSLTIAGV